MLFSKVSNLNNYLNNDDLISIFHNYINCKVIDIEEIEGGYENNSFKLITDNNIYKMRISSVDKDKDFDGAQVINKEIELMNYLIGKGFKLPKCHKSLSSYEYYERLTVKERVFYIVIFDYVIGIHLTYNFKNIDKFATMQSRMHKKLSEYKSEYVNNGYSAFSFRFNPNICAENLNDLVDYTPEIDIYNYISQILSDYMSNSVIHLIHNDLKADNLLLDMHGDIHIIDFGDIRVSVIEEDIGVFIWDMCDKLYKLKKDYITYVDYYLESYISNTELKGNLIKYISILYAIERYLSINLYYLLHNKDDHLLMKYQKNKSSYQFEIVKNLFLYAMEINL